jgi:hypothetical protein
MANEDMGEYLLKCPTCATQTKVVCEEDVGPVIMVCQGCSRTLVMHQNRLFTVPVETMVEIMRRHRVRVCGNIVATKLSDEAQVMVDDRKISELHKALESNDDVLDVIRKF